MTCEKYWEQQRKTFLEEAGQAEGDSALLALYRRLLEKLKTNALSDYPHDKTLCQAISLLFDQAVQGSELYLARSMPTLERSMPEAERKVPAILSLLAKPVLLYAVLAAGLVFSLLAGSGAWRCAVFFVAGLGLALARLAIPEKKQEAVSVRTGIRPEYLDAMIQRQAKLLDRQIADLRTLLDSIMVPADLPMDPVAMKLCQYVWAYANGSYPAESALYTAEKLLKNNDLCWADYSADTRRMYEVLPTRKDSRTVYPALQKCSDGTMAVMGQYLEKEGSGE